MRYAIIERDTISKYLLPGQVIPRLFHARDTACAGKRRFRPSTNLPFRCTGMDDGCMREHEPEVEASVVLVKTWPGGVA